MRAKLFKIPLILMLCLIAASCRKNPAEEAEQSAPEPLLKAEVVRGPLSFRITTDRDTLTISDQLTLTLSAEAPEDFSFEFPKFGKGLEPFGIVDYKTEPARISDRNTILYSRSYILEPLFAETYEIPTVKGIFRENGNNGKIHELESEPFSITVQLPPQEFWEKLDIDTETGLEPVQALISKRKQNYIYYAIGTIAGLLLASILILYFRKRKKQIDTPPAIPPHVKALAALQKLIEEDFVGKNEFKLFYLHISAILRIYIEERFHIHAPELTTQEFLEILTKDQSLLKNHQKLLQNFLTHCDMVKFAEHQPDKNEIQNTFDACKAFIRQTA